MYNTTLAEQFLSALDEGDNACNDGLQFAEENATALQVETLHEGLLIRAKFADGSRLTATIVDDCVDEYDFADGSW